MSEKANPAAVKSLSRRLLVRLMALQPDLDHAWAASFLVVSELHLSEYLTGHQLMPLDVQERLAAFVLIHEPRLSRVAHGLQAQVQAARRYEAGEVVSHLSSPRWPR